MGQSWTSKLQYAIESNDEATYKELINTGDVSVNINYGYMNPPLYLAVWYGNVGCATWLLTIPNIDPNKDGGPMLLREGPLFLAASKNDYAMVETLLAHPDIDPNKGVYNTPLWQAIRNNSVESAEALLKHPALNVNYDFGSAVCALHRCIHYQRVEILELLLQHHDLAMFTATESHALVLLALATCSVGVLTALLRRPAEIRLSEVSTPEDPFLKEGCLPSNIPVTATVAAHLPCSALMVALLYHHEVTTSGSLAWSPTKTRGRANSGTTVGLHTPATDAAKGATDVVVNLDQPLLGTMQGKDGGSLLQASTRIIELLLSAPNVNVTEGTSKLCSNTMTPLHYVAQEGMLSMAQILVAHPTAAPVKNAEGKTPAEVAEAAGHGAVAAVLRELDAKQPAQPVAMQAPAPTVQPVPQVQPLPATLQQ
eukprot:TRINITY_DN76766_c0_g1_i1.p1 TRINITY_DN76766_c0_g1~~TRINITY_DN76766_c0_g1_i1.p1  ORF type:complete len:426 (-),score=41.48 TRINITY_DN76766_c0_g1_i1:203-1480(-)